jgi:AAA+ superfamily predicted ATPase
MALPALVSVFDVRGVYVSNGSAGKTMTVECIATQMNRPLLCLTVADIGTEETSVEGRLAKYLGLATKWGAIVLIDEAETFLTKRKEGDLSRNALVTAFLRALEYYSGMIFLTTNEPGRIDDAVTSRIHLAIKYKDLTKADRQKIWRAHIRELAKQQSLPSWPMDVPKVKVDPTTQTFIESETDTPAVEALKLSGRDIRNAFQTAVQLARYSAEQETAMDGKSIEISMTEENFKQAMETKFALKREITHITGMDQDERAIQDGTRRPGTPKS